MRETTAERWKPIPGRPGYEASTHGRIRSLDREILCKDGKTKRLKGQIRKPVAANKGHLFVQFGHTSRSVHTLVLEAWVGPRPDGMWGCHADDNPTNNHLSNLRWATPTENHADMKRNTGHYATKKTHCPRDHALEMPNLTGSAARIGYRDCLACNRASAIRSYRRLRGQHVPEMKPLADAYYAEIMAKAKAAS